MITKKGLKLGFIGGGLNSAVGNTHFIASQMDGLFSVVAGCFCRDSELNLKTAEKWGIDSQRTYRSSADLLAAEAQNLDCVVVLSPTPEHFHHVSSAMKAGLNVICEKSLAMTSSEALELIEVAEQKNKLLAVTYNYSGYPMVRELRQMISAGRLGKLEQLHIEMPQEGYARLNRQGQPVIPQQWRLRDGPVPTISLDLGVHIHHLVDFLTGAKPLEVVATQSSLGRFRQVVDTIQAIVHYTESIEASFWFSKASLGHRNGLRLRVYGDEGSAEWLQMEPEILLFSDTRGRQMRIDRANIDVEISHLERYNRFKSGHPAGFLEAFANLYTDIAAELHGDCELQQSVGFPLFSPWKAWEGLVFFEAVNRSAQERRWVTVPQVKNSE
jgi:predicted dehydrogenase